MPPRHLPALSRYLSNEEMEPHPAPMLLPSAADAPLFHDVMRVGAMQALLTKETTKTAIRGEKEVCPPRVYSVQEAKASQRAGEPY